MEPLDVQELFGRFDDHWTPRLIAELNGQEVKIAKVKGEFTPHRHEDADELFYVVRGRLEIRFPAGAPSGPASASGGLRGMEGRAEGAGERPAGPETVRLDAGQLLVVPRGVLHQPVAEEEAWILLFEPAGTRNTGDVVDERTVEDPERL